MHGYEVMPNVIKSDGIDSFRVEVNVNRTVNAVAIDVSTASQLLNTPADLTFRDDGLQGDRIAGDLIFTSGEFTYDTSKAFPTNYLDNADSPSGIYAVSIGQILITETDNSVSEFLVRPKAGLIRDDITILQPAAHDDDMSYTPHVINMKTESPVTQGVMRQGGTLQPVGYRLYEEFPDAFDFIMLTSTSKVEHVDRLESRNFTSGAHAKVKADYTGTGYDVRDSTANFDSAGRLMSFNLIDYMTRGLTTNNVTHEMVHQWNAYIDVDLGISGDKYGHYGGRTSAGSLVGGNDWIPNGDGSYTIDFSEGRNGGTMASEIELYMMGLIDASEVSPIMAYDETIPFKSPSDPVVLASEIVATVSIEDIIARHGEWAAVDGTVQTDFNIAFLAESSGRLLTPVEMTFYDILAEHYTKPISLSEPAPHLSNGWQSIDRYFGHGTSFSTDIPVPYIPMLIEDDFGGTTAPENSGDSFYVSLQKQPSSNVVINVASDSPNDVTVAQPSLTFTPTNWSDPQRIRISGVNDGVVDGDKVVHIDFSVDTALSDDAFDHYLSRRREVLSADRNFHLAVDDVSVPEGNPGDVKHVEFTLTPTTSYFGFEVDYEIVDGTASAADGDYILPVFARQPETSYSVLDFGRDGNGDQVRVDLGISGTAVSTGYRLIEEFFIGDVSTDLTTAQFDFTLRESNGGGSGLQEFDVVVFAADGVASTSDFQTAADIVGRVSYTVGTAASHSVDLRQKILELRNDGHEWIGVRLQPVGSAFTTRIFNTELALQSPTTRQGTLSFSGIAGEGVTIAVQLGADQTYENNESFQVRLLSEDSYWGVIDTTRASAVITVENDDDLAADSTPPTSAVDTLPFSATSKTFSVSVNGSDPNIFGQLQSGVSSYDIYVASESDPFSYWTTVTAASPSADFTGESNTFYSFRSVATDVAGNQEAKPVGSEAFIYVPDLDAPDTQVTAVDSSTATFEISVSGSDVSGPSIDRFEVYVAIDGGAPQKIAELPASEPDLNGLSTSTTLYQAIADGVQHTYRFYSVGVDARGNVEAPPAQLTDDIVATATFVPPPALAVAGFDVQKGANQRSYVRYLDVLFNTATGVQGILDSVSDADASNDRIHLKRYGLDGSGPGDNVGLMGGVIQRRGSAFAFDFGSSGLTGNAGSAVGDGYYELSIDLDGDNIVDRQLYFYRLFGDTNGDGKVDQQDVNNIRKSIRRNLFNSDYDIDGDGEVSVIDLLYTRDEKKKSLLGGLFLDD